MRLRTVSMRARTIVRLRAKPSSSGLSRRRQNDRVDHRIAARQAEQPDAVLVGGRLQRGAQGELVAARLDLKRNDQGPPPRIPIEADVGVVDRHAGIFAVAIDDGAGFREHLALHRCGVPSEEISARMLADSGRSTSKMPSLRRIARRMSRDETCAPRCRPRVRRRRAGASPRSAPRDGRDCPTPDERSRRPGGPRQARIDPAEGPTLAVALVVDDQIAVLRPSSRRSWPSSRSRRCRRSRP